MSSFVYPSSDLDRSRSLLSVLGSFWTRTYTRRDQLISYVDGTALLVAQSYLNLLEAAASLSRFTVPIFHTENWVPLVLRKSQRNAVQTNVARFDRTGAVLDGTLTFDTAEVQPFYAFPKPKDLVAAGQIFDRLVYPKVALSENMDYSVDLERDAIVFAADPFENAALLRKPIYDNKILVDEEITLWAFKGLFDYKYVFNQFGYALGMKLKSSKGYRDLMNAVMNGLVNGGASGADLDLAFSAICDVPVVIEQQEIVEIARRDAHGTFVATDKHVYRFPEDVNLLVAAGDTVRAGQALCDAFQIFELTAGDVPAGISALALERGFLAACYYGDLVFENKEVPLEVDTDHPLGYTFVKFGLGGFPADVEQFFADLHSRGISAAQTPQNDCFARPITYDFFAEFPAAGTVGLIYYARSTQQYYEWLADEERYREVVRPAPARKLGTLAHLLDRRKNPSGEPSAANLPTTINPLKFVVENILRNNVFIVQIKSAGLGQNRLGLYNIRHLRQLIPPHAAMLVLYEIDAAADVLAGPDNLTETTTTFHGMEPQADTLDENNVHDIGAVARLISMTCQ